MFLKVSPEQAGISSKNVFDFFKAIEKYPFSMHEFVMIHDDKLFAEAFYKPFANNTLHRCYSQTKSFVSLAIGLLVDDKAISLDDKLYSYFKDEIKDEISDVLKSQTIRQTLTMQTCTLTPSWFTSNEEDRLKLYFKRSFIIKEPGTEFAYDSAASEVLSILVEKLTGKDLLTFLKERLFNEMGIFKDAYILKTPCNYSWGDSGLIASIYDMCEVIKLLMNKGKYNGKQLISKEYVELATSKQVETNTIDTVDCKKYGYGFQIWKVNHDGFAFFGMGDQLTVCYPDKKLIFASFGDNQGKIENRQVIFDNFEKLIYQEIKDEPLLENKNSYDILSNYLNNLELSYLEENVDISLLKMIDKTSYVCNGNNLGINKFSLSFDENYKVGTFKYENKQGNKEIIFGINHNEFGYFPEEGYSNKVGKEKTTGFYYKCASSGRTKSSGTLEILVQIIDIYLGHLLIEFDFNDVIRIKMKKVAENFLNEYDGELIAYKEK